MEPIPETVWAIEELGPFVRGGDLLEDLVDLGVRALRVVPDLVGLTVDSQEHGVTFALLAHESQRAVLGVLQDEASHSRSSSVDAGGADDLLDEAIWQQRAQTHAAPCVLSTLTLPLVQEARITGCVSLYAASRQAFVGHHDELARQLGAWVEGAVTNADLSFSTLHEALRAPHRLQAASTIDMAVDIVSTEQRVSVPVARNRIQHAAGRAGISESQLAEAVIVLRGT